MAIRNNFGFSFPLGARVYPEGVNFSLYSEHATAIELLLFNQVDDSHPSDTIHIHPRRNRTGHYWHIFVPDLKPGQLYGYCVDGPYEPWHGMRYDPDKLLLDPYGRGLSQPADFNRHVASLPGENYRTAMKSVVLDPRTYDWEGDKPIQRSYASTVIYELHVGGFTRHPNSGLDEKERGTYAGLIKKIPYLKDLGITAVELLPVFQFDEQDAPAGLVNYWGYSPVSFFAPHCGYSSRKDPLGPINEFRDMVKALHRAGIEVILDVVYNHSAEGNHNGPTYCFKGIENSAYYTLENDPFYYANFTGTGNTLNANHSVVRRMIIDSLHYWVQYMHVDGFRFDLASILARDENGQPLQNPPVLWDIDTDPYLAGTKLIAEAWDAGGLYQVGSFIGDFWKEWNGKFRDDVRSFLRVDDHTVSRLSHRLMASPDLYADEEQGPEQSINFVTCHDGFTLNDLVSYNEKHNQANGENNRDGSDNNLSWNCGVEGPTDNKEIDNLRNRQIKNFFVITLLSLGTPMILMGDEIRRTQQGNNNAYCQDNEISWFDWSLLDRYAGLLRFVKRMIYYRLHRGDSSDELTLNQVLSRARIQWHGVKLNQPDWGDHSHSLAFTARIRRDSLMIHVMINAYHEALEFELPPLSGESGECWHLLVDTSRGEGEDIYDWGDDPPVTSQKYLLLPYSIVMLISKVA